jgi:hypothetical protein
MAKLNKTDFTIRLRRGLRSRIERLDQYHVQGEPGYATDNKTLFVSDGTAFQPMQTVDMLVCHDDQIMFHAGEPVIIF